MGCLILWNVCWRRRETTAHLSVTWRTFFCSAVALSAMTKHMALDVRRTKIGMDVCQVNPLYEKPGVCSSYDVALYNAEVTLPH